MGDVKRKLATIRRIHQIQPIVGADLIELILIDGWQCVAKKGEFNISDWCVYFEIDSFLPIRSEFEFLRKSCYKKMGVQEGFRLKTIRLKGALSQGLALPLTLFPMITEPTIGEDVTDLLEVVKYEPPIPAQLSGLMAGTFPSFIPKTDQERVQNMFYIMPAVPFEVTEKLDGSSITFYYKDGHFGVCTRNFELKREGGDSYWATVNRLNFEEKVICHGKNLAFQGELIGYGIQKNIYALNTTTVKIFNVFDINTYQYLSPEAARDLVTSLFGEEFYCPLIFSKFTEKFSTISDILNFAEEKSALNPLVEREGVVFKSIDHCNPTFKAISNKFLELE